MWATSRTRSSQVDASYSSAFGTPRASTVPLSPRQSGHNIPLAPYGVPHDLARIPIHHVLHMQAPIDPGGRRSARSSCPNVMSGDRKSRVSPARTHDLVHVDVADVSVARVSGEVVNPYAGGAEDGTKSRE